MVLKGRSCRRRGACVGEAMVDVPNGRGGIAVRTDAVEQSEEREPSEREEPEKEILRMCKSRGRFELLRF